MRVILTLQANSILLNASSKKCIENDFINFFFAVFGFFGSVSGFYLDCFGFEHPIHL
jgi:hypothetical protein